MSGGAASAVILAGEEVGGQPWPRRVLGGAAWNAMRTALGQEPGLALVGLWADAGQVHALFLGEVPVAAPIIASTSVERGFYGALSPWRPGAGLFERIVMDLWGHRAAEALDPRSLLDHGAWPILHPMGARPVPNTSQPEPWEPLAVPGTGLNAIPIGPVQGGIGEACHLRVTAAGDAVVRLEARLGYGHRGALALLRGKPPRSAAGVVARLSAGSTVAHAVAFARAVEAATGLEVPPRAAALRGVAAELERLASHLGDLRATVSAAGAGRLGASLAWTQEAVLRACEGAFGHRLLMDAVVPGGVVRDLSAEGVNALHSAVDEVAGEVQRLTPALSAPALLADRLRGVGAVSPDVVARFAPGGVVGRAAGRDLDLRRALPYPPYDGVPANPASRQAGDAAARTQVRLAEIEESLSLLRALLASLPDGPLTVSIPSTSGEGLGWAEGARGDVWHWVRIDGGTVAASFARDPSALHWPVLEAAAAGRRVDEVPLIAASIGALAAGVDL